MNLTDGLSEQAEKQPNGLAVIRGRHTITFQRLDRLVWALAQRLVEKGITPRDVVGLTFADEVSHFIASLALMRMGSAQVTLAASEPVQVRNTVASRLGVALTLADAEVPAGLTYRVLPVDVGQSAEWGPAIHPGARFDGPPSWPVLLFTGSGTTGRAKTLMLTSDVFKKRGEMELFPLVAGERYVTSVPLDYYLSKLTRLGFLFKGLTNVFLEKGDDLVQVSNLLRVDRLMLMVIHAEALIRANAAKSHGLLLPYARTLAITGSKVREELRRAVRSRLTHELLVMYGANEVYVATTASASVQDRYPGAVGPAFDGISVEVVDGYGNVLPAGEVGEIRIRSPCSIAGYHDDPDATAKAFRDGWYYPRDLGSMTEDGVLIFQGRSDDMMIFDSINIFPREIELALEQHPSVTEALAFPLPDPVHQDIPAAAVTLRGSATEEELIAFCRERLGAHSPRRVMIVAEFPEVLRGKIMRRQFHRLLAARTRS